MLRDTRRVVRAGAIRGGRAVRGVARLLQVAHVYLRARLGDYARAQVVRLAGAGARSPSRLGADDGAFVSAPCSHATAEPASAVEAIAASTARATARPVGRGRDIARGHFPSRELRGAMTLEGCSRKQRDAVTSEAAGSLNIPGLMHDYQSGENYVRLIGSSS